MPCDLERVIVVVSWRTQCCPRYFHEPDLGGGDSDVEKTILPGILVSG